MVLSPLVQIEVNHLLRGSEPTASLDEARATRDASKLTGLPLGAVDDATLERVHATYGESGLFQLITLGMAHEEQEFGHFYEVTTSWLAMRGLAAGEAVPLRLDNAELRQSADGARLGLNVLQPSLSRKLYRVGRHHGSLVYGFGGPRILVSHPFLGRAGDVYDVYMNSVDVVTSLHVRGFDGVFHFLDYLPGLNATINGVPGWLAWFAIIAAHSDVVVFIRDTDKGFRKAQQQEIAFVPDRVQKTIVDMPPDELRWAKVSEDDIKDLPRMYIGTDGAVSEKEWFAMEAAHAMPFIEFYTEGGLPDDRFIVIDEAGEAEHYTLDSRIYGPLFA